MNDKFDLQRAIDGDPIEKECGTTVSFVAYIPTAKADRQLIVQDGYNVLAYYANGRYINQVISSPFDLRMKSVVKQVDWSKMPVDTLLITQAGYSRYFKGFTEDNVTYYAEGRTSESGGNCPIGGSIPRVIQISPNQPWKIWFGGECPIPDGLEFEYMIHGDPGQAVVCTESASAYLWQPKLIYAYRLTGKVLDGYSL
jgi:hypothetical protein